MSPLVVAGSPDPATAPTPKGSPVFVEIGHGSLRQKPQTTQRRPKSIQATPKRSINNTCTNNAEETCQPISGTLRYLHIMSPRQDTGVGPKPAPANSNLLKLRREKPHRTARILRNSRRHSRPSVLLCQLTDRQVLSSQKESRGNKQRGVVTQCVTPTLM